MYDNVSIHAPGRGATRSMILRTACTFCFNSRTREGCDSTYLENIEGHYVFQFTHPGGVRHSPHRELNNTKGRFQFTHPGGVRQRGQLGRAQPRNVSIHAPGRGATTSISSSSRWVMMFQFTHPGGVRRQARLSLLRRRRFNSRTREGCDATQEGRPTPLRVSIHAPGRGAT